MAAILVFLSERFCLLLIYNNLLNTTFQVNWTFNSGEEAKLDFEDGGHVGPLGFPNGMILAIFDLEVTLIIST